MTAKRQTKLERLRSQGTLVSVDIGGGQMVPYFSLPTPELQSEWNEALESWIKKDLKANGFKLIQATKREHPFHSEILRERIDELASVLSDDFKKELTHEEGIEDERQCYRECYDQFAQHVAPNNGVTAAELRDNTIDWQTEQVVQKNRRAWAAAFNKYRNFLRDPNWWAGTYLDRIINPTDAAPLPDGPPPKPVFMKPNHDVVLCLRGNGAVDFWIRCLGC
ncbi:MAG: hypothetical protein KGK33_06895 [Hyphomicrobiales bacterium]|nr:hypothetical protein [Hyphomicrobiales bacterium]